MRVGDRAGNLGNRYWSKLRNRRRGAAGARAYCSLLLLKIRAVGVDRTCNPPCC
jgi:hypothetical protein